MNVHYDNPSGKEGHTDNSGIKMFLKKTPREHDIGVLQLGDGYVTLYGTTIPAGTSVMQTECPSECTAQLSGPVHVFNSMLHEHQTGARMVSPYTPKWSPPD